MTDTTPAPTTQPEKTIGQRQLDAIAGLRALVAWRAEVDAEISADHESATSAATETHRNATAAANTTHEEETAKLAAEVDRVTKEIARRAEKETGDERARFERERRTTDSKLGAKQKEVEDAIRDSKWMAEAVYDAGGRQPEQELNRVRSEVRAQLERMEVIEARARKLSGPRVEMPETRPPADEVDAAPTPQPAGGDETDPNDQSEDERPLDAMIRLVDSAEDRVRRLGGVTLHAAFRLGLPLLAMFVALIGGAFAGGFLRWEQPNIILWIAGLGVGSAAVVGVLCVPLRILALRGTANRLAPMAEEMIEARGHGTAAVRVAAGYKQRVEAEIAERRQQEIEAGKARYQRKLEKAIAEREMSIQEIDERHERKNTEIEKRRVSLTETLERERSERHERIERTFAEATAEANAALAQSTADTDAAREDRYDAMRTRWRRELGAFERELGDTTERVRELCPAWDDPSWDVWSPPPNAAESVSLGRFGVDLAELEGGLPGDPGLMDGLAGRVDPPAVLDFPGKAALLVEADEASRPAALGTLQDAMSRLVTAIPPGKVRFTMIDPVGLGQSFAAFMRLADHDERLVAGRIWTELRHIEQRLADLTEHMENGHPEVPAQRVPDDRGVQPRGGRDRRAVPIPGDRGPARGLQRRGRTPADERDRVGPALRRLHADPRGPREEAARNDQPRNDRAVVVGRAVRGRGRRIHARSGTRTTCATCRSRSRRRRPTG